MSASGKSLRDCALFSGLNEASLRQLARHTRLRRYRPEQMLFAQGDASEGFFLVRSGLVKVFCSSAEGREQALHFFGPGEVCGEVPVFQGKAFPASAIAVRATEAYHVPRQLFVDTARTHPEVLLTMLASLSARLRRFVSLIDDLSLREVPARVAKYILDEAARKGENTFVIQGTKAALAERLGTSPETLSRALSALRRQGVINVWRREITVTNRQGLLDRAAGLSTPRGGT